MMQNYPTHILTNWANRLDDFMSQLTSQPRLTAAEQNQLDTAAITQKRIDLELESRMPDLAEVDPEIF